MPFYGDVGRTYSRHDVTGALGIQPTSKGNWSNGYPRFDDEFFIFTTIGEDGRVKPTTGPNYDTWWEDGALSWPTDNMGHLGQATVNELVSNLYPVHVFFRYSDRSDFIYAGAATAERVEGARPVRVRWVFQQPQRNVLLRGTLAAKGFQLHRPGTYVQLASHTNLNVYVKTRTEEAPLVLPPHFEGNADALLSINGVRKSEGNGFYHNSGMKHFPKRQNNGTTPISFGLAIAFENGEALSNLIDLTLQLSPSTHQGNRGRQRGKHAQEDPRTETEARRAARLGQSGFRADLLQRYDDRCPLTGVDMPDVLRASHIKPWHKASPSERLDPDNGLLLSVHLDLLFDKGLISFEDNGNVKLSSRLKPTVIAAYGLRQELRLSEVFPGNFPFLEFHRLYVFK
ncbi:HNH endonuclease [Agrobacterium radiobacter]|uniref:HNH endonuclease n=1 Tax=Agrobacterium radiobacter TaxID=362 RepID=UPI0034472F04